MDTIEAIYLRLTNGASERPNGELPGRVTPKSPVGRSR